jgi:hypothetical protein
MKNLDLNNYGVHEMNAGEMKATDGGFLVGLIFAVVSCVIGVIMQHKLEE